MPSLLHRHYPLISPARAHPCPHARSNYTLKLHVKKTRDLFRHLAETTQPTFEPLIKLYDELHKAYGAHMPAFVLRIYSAGAGIRKHADIVGSTNRCCMPSQRLTAHSHSLALTRTHPPALASCPQGCLCSRLRRGGEPRRVL